MNRPARSALAVATVAAVLLGAAGCRTSPGAAAIVGNDRITTDTLQSEVAQALRDPSAQSAFGTDRAGFTRTALGRLIQNEIIGAAAASHHITATTGEVDTQIQEFAVQAGGMSQLEDSAAQSGIPKSELRTYIRYYVLEQKLGNSLVQNLPVSQSDLQAAYQQNIDQFDTVHAAHILVKSKALADRILAEVKANPSKFAALAAKYSTDTGSKGNGGDLGDQPKSQFVPEFGNPVFAAKPGSFIEVHSQFGWHVVHVISHDTKPLSQVRGQIKAQLLQNQRDRLLSEALRQEGDKLGVYVNPRYGRWDPNQGAVVAVSERGGVVSPSPSPSGAAPALPTG